MKIKLKHRNLKYHFSHLSFSSKTQCSASKTRNFSWNATKIHDVVMNAHIIGSQYYFLFVSSFPSSGKVTFWYFTLERWCIKFKIESYVHVTPPHERATKEPLLFCRVIPWITRHRQNASGRRKLWVICENVTVHHPRLHPRGCSTLACYHLHGTVTAALS